MRSTTTSLDATQLMELARKQWDMLLQAWNFYLIVSFVLVLVVLLAPVARTNRRVFWYFLAGFLFFAWTHLLGLLYILKQWKAVTGLLLEKWQNQGLTPEQSVALANAGLIDSPDAIWVVPFHLIADALVIVGLWLFSRRSPSESA